MLLAVYGTLRKGGRLEEYINWLEIEAMKTESKIFRREVVELSGLKIYVVGAVPGAKITNDCHDKAIVDLIHAQVLPHVEEAYLEFLDQVEGVEGGLYKRSYIKTPKGKALVYTFVPELPENTVSTMDWLSYLEKPAEERLEDIKKAGAEVIILR